MDKQHNGYNVDLNGNVLKKTFTGEKTTTEEQRKEIKRKITEEKFSKEKFVKYLFESRVHSKLIKLDNKSHKIFSYLLGFLNYDSSVRFKNYKKIKTRHIADFFGWKERTVRTYISKLVKIRAIKREKGTYYINPEIAYRGNIPQELIDIFQL